ncbi:MAG: hypothetical protein Q9181_005619 [Wetmoreana brouardii]
MEGKIPSRFSVENRTSNARASESMADNLQYPEPAAQPDAWPNQSVVPSQLSSTRTSLRPTRDDIYHFKGLPDRASVSAASSASPRGRQGSRAESRQYDHYMDPAARFMSDQRGSSTQNPYSRPNNPSFRDPEKANYMQQQAPNGPHQNLAHSTYISEDEEDVKEHTVWILIYLSFLSPVVATLTSIYTIIMSFIFLLFSPITICCRSCTPLKQRLVNFLAPPIRLQLDLVFSAVEPAFDSLEKSEEYTRRTSNIFLLVMINILSPIYAAGIAVTAWIAAGFWFTALILGDPDGRDKKDDGRAVVLGVRRLWERWLKKGLR